MIVSYEEPVALVGGGEVCEGDIAEARHICKHFVAADGGARVLLDHDIMPEAVIGDCDSIDAATKAALPPGTLRHIPEQYSTDFDKCLRNIVTPLILGIGFLGARVDHQLGAFNRLVARPDCRCVLLGAEDVVVHLPPKLSFTVALGTRVSLFPMAAVTGRSAGLRWPIHRIPFAPSGNTGTSNEASETRVTIFMDYPGMLLILPRAELHTVIKAVQSKDCGTWSAPAEQ